jgi:hypothetical protein
MTDGLKFRDISALEVLRDGQSEAMGKLLEAAVHMEGFATGADMRFAAIEARLTALEARWNPDTAPVHHVSEELRQKLAREANEAVPGGTGFGRLVQATPRQAHVEQLPQDRDAEGGAVEAGGEVPLQVGRGTPIARDDG